MKTKRIKLISVVLSVFLILSCVSLLLINSQKNEVYAAEVIVGEWTQKDGALLGDTLELPENVKLKIEGEEVVPESGLIIYPNGNASALGTKLLDSVGVYTLRYTAKYNGKEYVGEQKFTVQDSTYYVSNPNFSSAEFVKADELKNTVVGERLGAKVADCIKVSMIEGNYFRYNQPININELTTDEQGCVEVSVAYPVLDTSIYATEKTVDGKTGNNDEPRYWGERYCWYLTVKLIDIYDESNFVEFYILSMQDQRNGHAQFVVGAGGSEQELTNLASATKDYDVTIDGSNWGVERASRYNGITYWSSQISRDTRTFFERQGVVDSFKFNPETYEVRFENDGGLSRIVTDLDHPGIYPGNGFEGFTTGEVYVQYEFVNKEVANSEPMELYIKSILGISGEDLINQPVDDTKVPAVEIDVEYTNKAEKSINIEYNKEFTLPTANVYDVNCENEYKVAVYYDYYTDNPKSVLVNDGKFIPDKKGVTYTAVYIAKDAFGNMNVDKDGKCLNVINMKVVSEKPFTYDGGNKINQFITCISNELPKIDVKSLNDDAETNVFIIEPNGNKINVTDNFNGNGYSFTPEYLGKYTVEYVFSDNVYTETFSYTVDSVDEGNIFYKEKIALPSVFIKGATYDLDAYFGYVATASGLSKKETTLFVSVDGGEFNKIIDRRNFVAQGDKNLTFYAECVGVKSPVQVCSITDVNYSGDASVNNGKKIYENYFVGFDSYTSDVSGVEYKFNGGKEINTLRFATPLVFNAFNLEFEISGESASGMSDLSILLKEISGRDDLGYIITYKKLATEGRLTVTVSGLDGVDYYNKSVDGNFVGSHKITIQNNTLTIPEIGALALPGVTSKNIEFSVLMDCSQQASSIKIKNVCGNVFNNNVYEKVAQIIYTRISGTIKVGEVYTLPTFNVNSVFYPVSLAKLTYSFTDTENNALVDINGNPVRNVVADNVVTFNPKEVKNYFFSFNYEGMKVIDVSTYVISVVDTTPPVVTFTDGSNDKTVVNVKVGETHKIKAYTVTDNVSTELNVKNVIMDYFGAVKGWDVGDSFVFTQEGEYKVVIFAQDENDNTTNSYYYKVKVTK